MALTQLEVEQGSDGQSDLPFWVLLEMLLQNLAETQLKSFIEEAFAIRAMQVIAIIVMNLV